MSSPHFDDINFEGIDFSSLLDALDDDPNDFSQHKGESSDPNDFSQHKEESSLSIDHNKPKIGSTVCNEETRPSLLHKSNVTKEATTCRTKERSKRIKSLKMDKMVMESGDEEGLTTKKHLHNAKERLRRLKVNESYLALHSLLPNSRRLKNRWTAPTAIDKVLDYIPELENEIEKLNLKRDEMKLSFNNLKLKQKQGQSSQADKPKDDPVVAVIEFKEGDVIVQTCTEKSDDDHENVFLKLMDYLDGQEICMVESASTLIVSQDRICCHLHIKMNGTLVAANFVAELREKLSDWLR